MTTDEFENGARLSRNARCSVEGAERYPL